MNDKSRLLIEKYINGLCTSQEKELVETWLDTWTEIISSSDIYFLANKGLEDSLLTKVNLTVALRERKKRRTKQHIYRISAAVASVCIVFMLITYLWSRHKEGSEKPEVYYGVVQPGSKSAVMLYGDGKQIILEDLEGALELANGIEVGKGQDDLMTLRSLENSQKEFEWNEVRVPKGGQYEMILMDGTKVFMNSASRIRFPNKFDSKERKVELEGEAYFEVSHSQTPFIVSVKNTEIRVLGTEFNVRSYGSESTYTTLVNGSVVVSTQHGDVKRLKPGNQAISAERIKVLDVEVNDFTSWRRGYFIFDFVTIEEVMNEIARWYDLDFEITSGVNKEEKIGGTYSRSKSLDGLLNYLEKLTGIKILEKDGKVTLTN